MANLGYDWTTIKSGSTTISGAVLTYYIEAKLTSQSVADNKSYISTRARTTLSGSMSTYYYSFSCTGCTTKSDPGGTIRWYYGNETVLEGSTSVSHNADGTGSLSMSGQCYGGGMGININISGSISLPTIPRASKPTVSKNSVTLNGTDSVTITTNRATSSFTHKLAIKVGTNTVNVNNVGESYVWTPGIPYWMPYMTSYSMEVTVTCTTYSGTTQIGSAQTVKFTLNVDTSTYKPTITAISHEDTNDTTLALETSGSYIKGYSNLKLTVKFGVNNSGYSSSLVSAKITVGSSSQTFNLSGTSGTATFTASGITAASAKIEVTDNRGYTVTQNKNLTLVDYSAVTISSVICERVNASGTPSETGDYVKYTIVCNVFQGNFGKQNNTLKLYSYSKQASASSYGSAVLEKTATPSGSNANASYTFTGITKGTYSASTQHDIRFRVYDSLSNKFANAYRVNEGVPVFAWGKDHFDVYGALHVHARGDVSDYVEMTVASLKKLINSDTASITTKAVTFSGASGGSVTWTIFKFGSFRIAVCKWRAASNATINSTWAGFYYSNDFGTPNFPFTFNDVLFLKTEYVAGDTAAHADCWNSGRSGSISKTTAGSVYLVRPNDGGPVTIGHPVFTEIVIGTV